MADQPLSRLPTSVDDLIDQLDEAYPDTLPIHPDFSADQLRWKAGQRSVVTRLLALRSKGY